MGFKKVVWVCLVWWPMGDRLGTGNEDKVGMVVHRKQFGKGRMAKINMMACGGRVGECG